MMWSKKDSQNLESIAKSLESLEGILARLFEREQERELVTNQKLRPTTNFFGRMKESLRKEIEKQQEIVVSGENSIEEAFFDERDAIMQSAHNRIARAEKLGNVPFFEEELLSAEELDMQ